jgi:hypothetical protein
LYKEKTKKEIIDILVNITELNKQLLYIYKKFFSRWELKDGIKLFEKNLTEKLGFDGSYMPHSKYWVSFHPNQIKLSDGTNTTFDGSNPDIRLEKGGEVGSFYKWFINWYKGVKDDITMMISVPNELRPLKEKGSVILEVF